MKHGNTAKNIWCLHFIHFDTIPFHYKWDRIKQKKIFFKMNVLPIFVAGDGHVVDVFVESKGGSLGVSIVAESPVKFWAVVN